MRLYKNIFNKVKNANYKFISIVIGLIAISGLAVYYVFATWAPPTAAPPGANVPAPINVSTTTQTFLGDKRLNFTTRTDVLSLGPGLGVDGVLHARSNLIVGGNVGIGTTAPTTALDVAGALTLRGMAAPSRAPAGQGRIYFDSTTNRFRISQDGGPFFDLVGGTPFAPSSLSAAAISATQINLSWLDNSADETGFQIERCTGAACTAFALVHTTAANATTWSNTGLAATTLFRYRVRAINAFGASAFSNIAEATTLSGIPLAPSSLSATAVSATQINLSWLDNSADETGFQIERCTGAACTAFALVHTTAANATTWSNTGLAASTLYRYRVRAINAFGASAYSNIAEATTLVETRLIFVTSSTHTGNLGGLAGADAICAARATAAGLPGTYRAWLSSATISARDRLTHHTGPYVRRDGVIVANNWAGLVSGSLLAPININEFGLMVAHNWVWSGTNWTGDGSGLLYCNNWLSADPHIGHVGHNAQVNTWWSLSGNLGCYRLLHLYCLQQ